MNKIASIIFCSLLLVACNQKTGEHDQHDQENNAAEPDMVEATGNQALYNEVMKIHDEVMPKIEDIHRLKTRLKEKIANNPDMARDERAKTEGIIARLDSAQQSMMDWMHEFQPVPDSVGEDKAKEYLENELKRINMVRDNILSALQDADTGQ